MVNVHKDFILGWKIVYLFAQPFYVCMLQFGSRWILVGTRPGHCRNPNKSHKILFLAVFNLCECFYHIDTNVNRCNYYFIKWLPLWINDILL